MKITKSLLQILPLAIIFLGLLGYNYMNAAWNNPPANPPNNNTLAPINIGFSGSTQAGFGDLAFDRFAAVNEMRSPKYCDEFGHNCINTADIISKKCPAGKFMTGFSTEGKIACSSITGLTPIWQPTFVVSSGRPSTANCPSGQVLSGLRTYESTGDSKLDVMSLGCMDALDGTTVSPTVTWSEPVAVSMGTKILSCNVGSAITALRTYEDGNDSKIDRMSIGCSVISGSPLSGTILEPDLPVSSGNPQNLLCRPGTIAGAIKTMSVTPDYIIDSMAIGCRSI